MTTYNHFTSPYIGNTILVTFFLEEKNEKEVLWVEPLENELYQVQSIPFFSHSVNYQDVIKISPDEENGYLFDKLVISSDFYTYRIKLHQHAPFVRILEDFSQIGVVVEEFLPSFHAVSVQGQENAAALSAYLQDLENQGYLEFDSLK